MPLISRAGTCKYSRKIGEVGTSACPVDFGWPPACGPICGDPQSSYFLIWVICRLQINRSLLFQLPLLKRWKNLCSTRKGGRMAIMIYYGHEGGDIERDAVLDFVSQLPQKTIQRPSTGH